MPDENQISQITNLENHEQALPQDSTPPAIKEELEHKGDGFHHLWGIVIILVSIGAFALVVFLAKDKLIMLFDNLVNPPAKNPVTRVEKDMGTDESSDSEKDTETVTEELLNELDELSEVEGFEDTRIDELNL